MRFHDPFTIEFIDFRAGFSREGAPMSIYYHEDSGFTGTPNECIRVWYVDHHDFNRCNP